MPFEVSSVSPLRRHYTWSDLFAFGFGLTACASADDRVDASSQSGGNDDVCMLGDDDSPGNSSQGNDDNDNNDNDDPRDDDDSASENGSVKFDLQTPETPQFPDADGCEYAEKSDLIYLLDEKNSIWLYHPIKDEFTEVGTFKCDDNLLSIAKSFHGRRPQR